MSEETNIGAEEQERTLSLEERKALRENMHKFHKEQIPYLKTQAEYEKLAADIEEQRARQLLNTMRIRQMLAQQNGPLMQEPENEEQLEEGLEQELSQEAPVGKGLRKLKKQ